MIPANTVAPSSAASLASVNISLNGPGSLAALRRTSMQAAAAAAATGAPPVQTCTACVLCRKPVSPLRSLSPAAAQYSLGKLLELLFYNDGLECADGSCGHNPRLHHVRYFIKHGVIGVMRCVWGGGVGAGKERKW